MADELTEEQTDKVLQFQEVTSIQDLNLCRDYLIQNQWNLDIAIREQLNIHESVPSTTSISSLSDIHDISIMNMNSSDQFAIARIETTDQQQHTSIPVGLFRYFTNFICNLYYTIIPSLVTTFLDIIFGNQNNNNQLNGAERLELNDVSNPDPLEDVLKFIEDYHIKYPQHPEFFPGNYDQALNEAAQELKFLLVYLHSDLQKVHDFCNETLGNSNVIEYINRKMIFWGCDILCNEGYRVSQIVNAKYYPIMVIYGLKGTRMMKMGLIVGDCSPTEFLKRLEVIVANNTMYLNQARQARFERIATQTLRQQQDEAFKLSLRADEEKEKLKQIQKDKDLKAQLDVNMKLMEEQIKRDEIAQLKKELSAKVPIEPPDSENSIHIVFKLPNGERWERRFLNTNTINDIYNFVFCHPHVPDTFEISTNFPKRIIYSKELHNKCKTKFLSEIGIKNREVLFINDLDA